MILVHILCDSFLGDKSRIEIVICTLLVSEKNIIVFCVFCGQASEFRGFKVETSSLGDNDRPHLFLSAILLIRLCSGNMDRIQVAWSSLPGLYIYGYFLII